MKRVSDADVKKMRQRMGRIGGVVSHSFVRKLFEDRADYEREIKELQAALELSLSGDIHHECLPVLGECMYGSQRCTEVSAVIRAARLLEAK